MAIDKIKTNAGSGGKLGHSNMSHRTLSDRIKRVAQAVAPGGRGGSARGHPRGCSAVSQLADFIERQGKQIKLRGREYTVEGISGEGEMCVGTFAGPRAKYSGVLCFRANVIGRPGAEVWSVLGSGGREVGRFAIHNGALIEVR